MSRFLIGCVTDIVIAESLTSKHSAANIHICNDEIVECNK